MKKLFESIDYAVKDDSSNVSLSVTIGNKQIGGSAAVLGRRIIARGEIQDSVLGKGSNLKGKVLRVKTAVSDVNDRTNEVVVTYLLKGGKKQYREKMTITVSEDGDAGIFTFVTRFV